MPTSTSTPASAPASTATSGGSEDDRQHIIIVGAGIIGVCTAYYLTRHPQFSAKTHRITIIESTRPASGASGKAGGLLALWAFPSQLVPLSFELHAQLAEEYNGEEEWGYRRLQTVSLEGNLTKTAASAAATPKKKKSKSTSAADADSIDLPVDLDWVRKDVTESWSALSGTDSTAQVHPYKFTMFMLRRAQESGAVSLVLGKVAGINCNKTTGSAESVEYTPTLSSTSTLTPSSNLILTSTSTSTSTSTFTSTSTSSTATNNNNSHNHSSSNNTSNSSSNNNSNKNNKNNNNNNNNSSSSNNNSTTTTLKADKIIVTVGPWTSRLLPTCPVSGLRAHSITITPSRPVSAYAVFTELKLAKGKYVSPEIYARKDEVYVCGEGDNYVEVPETTDDVEVLKSRCDELVKYAGVVSNELQAGRITRRQACYLPVVDVPSTSGPLVGLTSAANLYVAAGHSCWGINNAPGTGKIMAEIVFEGQARSADVSGLDPRRYFVVA
ncbi:FAD dependent oxidoreductase [Lipomyces japonicus]|uniref:FAD dependent oxidoreductase n=1 Tax=Lipomyces japonicus TaxID=56871 RepID=UPI0034CEE94D